MKITDDFALHPLLLQDLERVHADLRAEGELRSREALEGYYDTFRQRFGPDVLRAMDGQALLSLIHETTQDGLIYCWSSRMTMSFHQSSAVSLVGLL